MAPPSTLHKLLLRQPFLPSLLLRRLSPINGHSPLPPPPQPNCLPPPPTLPPTSPNILHLAGESYFPCSPFFLPPKPVAKVVDQQEEGEDNDEEGSGKMWVDSVKKKRKKKMNKHKFKKRKKLLRKKTKT